MPTRRPRRSKRPPPELPGLMGASIWIIGTPSSLVRPMVLTTPAVTVSWRPKGLPMANTWSPWRRPPSGSSASSAPRPDRALRAQDREVLALVGVHDVGGTRRSSAVTGSRGGAADDVVVGHHEARGLDDDAAALAAGVGLHLHHGRGDAGHRVRQVVLVEARDGRRGRRRVVAATSRRGRRGVVAGDRLAETPPTAPAPSEGDRRGPTSAARAARRSARAARAVRGAAGGSASPRRRGPSPPGAAARRRAARGSSGGSPARAPGAGPAGGSPSERAGARGAAGRRSRQRLYRASAGRALADS